MFLSFAWDRKNRLPLSQRAWHDKEPSTLKGYNKGLLCLQLSRTATVYNDPINWLIWICILIFIASVCVEINQFDYINKNVKKGNGHLGIQSIIEPFIRINFIHRIIYTCTYQLMYIRKYWHVYSCGSIYWVLDNMLFFTIAGGLTEMETMPYLTRQFSL